MSDFVKYFDIDSSFRNRKSYPNPYDFVVPFAYPIRGSTSADFFDPILESAPYSGSSVKKPGVLLTGISTDEYNITIDSSEPTIDNYYIGNTFQIGNEFRIIKYYIGSTRTIVLEEPLSMTPSAGTVYFIRKMKNYFNSDVVVMGYDSLTKTVNKLSLLSLEVEPERDFYSGSYIRYTNGNHDEKEKVSFVTKFLNEVEVAYSQNVMYGSNEYLSKVQEKGVLFFPQISGRLLNILFSITCFDSISTHRTLQIKVIRGFNYGGTVIYQNTFNVGTTSLQTEINIEIPDGPMLFTPGYYIISLLDVTPTIDTGYINFFGIVPEKINTIQSREYPFNSSQKTTFNFEVYPKIDIVVMPLGNPTYVQDSSIVYPLELVQSANSTCAYSLRKLTSSYNGPCVRVRRTSDNQEKDIYFSGIVINVSELTKFVGTNDGYVTKWYDQSGNENHAFQTTIDFQPIVVINGNVSTFEGIPVVFFSKPVNFLIIPNPPFPSGTSTFMISIVCKQNALIRQARYFDFGNGPDSISIKGIPYVPFFGEFSWFSTNESDIAIGLGGTGRSIGLDNHVLNFVHDGGSLKITEDSVLINTRGATPPYVTTVNYIGQRMKNQDVTINAMFQEFICFGSNPSVEDTSRIDVEQRKYYNIPKFTIYHIINDDPNHQFTISAFSTTNLPGIVSGQVQLEYYPNNPSNVLDQYLDTEIQMKIINQYRSVPVDVFRNYFFIILNNQINMNENGIYRARYTENNNRTLGTFYIEQYFSDITSNGNYVRYDNQLYHITVSQLNDVSFSIYNGSSFTDPIRIYF